MKTLLSSTANQIGIHTFVALREAGFEPVMLDNFRNSSRGLDNTSGFKTTGFCPAAWRTDAVTRALDALRGEVLRLPTGRPARFGVWSTPSKAR